MASNARASGRGAETSGVSACGRGREPGLLWTAPPCAAATAAAARDITRRRLSGTTAARLDAAGSRPRTRGTGAGRLRRADALAPPDGPGRAGGLPLVPLPARNASVSLTRRRRATTAPGRRRPGRRRQDGLGDEVEGRDEVGDRGQRSAAAARVGPGVLAAERGPHHAGHGAGALPHRRAARARRGPHGAGDGDGPKRWPGRSLTWVPPAAGPNSGQRLRPRFPRTIPGGSRSLRRREADAWCRRPRGSTPVARAGTRAWRCRRSC